MSDERRISRQDAPHGPVHSRATKNRIAVISARLREGAYDADVVLEATAREIIARRDLRIDPRSDR